MRFDAPSPSLAFGTITLEKRLHAIQGAVSERILRDVSVETHMDEMCARLLIRLSKHVLEDHVLTETQMVPYSTEENVTLPEPRWHPAPAAVSAIGLTFAGIAAGSAILIATSFIVAFIGVWLCSRRHPTIEQEITVSGEVAVKLDSYRAFPEATIRYPDDLGTVVRLQVMEQA